MSIIAKKWNEKNLTLEDVEEFVLTNSENVKFSQEEVVHIAGILHQIYMWDVFATKIDNFGFALLKDKLSAIISLANNTDKKALCIYNTFLRTQAPSGVLVRAKLLS